MVQFINILDFMMVMPLGPDFANALAISNAELGWVGGSYTAASAFSGIICSLFMDKFDRKSALLVALSGLMLATCLGGFAWDFKSLLLTRIIAGFFGGPATSLVYAIIADVIPKERRGQAMGKVMGAFSLAAILGVPFSLEVANISHWYMPFFTVSALGVAVIALTLKIMPSMRNHIASANDTVTLRYMWYLMTNPLNMLAYLYIFTAMLASFMVIPNISAYVQYNMHYPRAHIGFLYSVGGIVSLVTLQVTGKLIDRFNSSVMGFISMVVYVITLAGAFIVTSLPIPVIIFFVLFMFALGMRNVSSNTLATKIPPPNERAGFMSLFSCFQGMGMATGAFTSTRVLTENADKSLQGMPELALISIVLSVIIPFLMRKVEQKVKKKYD